LDGGSHFHAAGTPGLRLTARHNRVPAGRLDDLAGAEPPRLKPRRGVHVRPRVDVTRADDGLTEADAAANRTAIDQGGDSVAEVELPWRRRRGGSRVSEQNLGRGEPR
jgi:hypothetical protein